MSGNITRPLQYSHTLQSYTSVKTEAEPPAGLCSLCVHFIMFQSTTSNILLQKLREGKRQNCHHDRVLGRQRGRQHYRQGLPVLYDDFGNSQNRSKLQMCH